MKRLYGPFAFVAVLLLFVGIVFQMLGADTGNAATNMRISVVMHGANPDRWRSLDQGIQQACMELGIEKPVIAVTGSNSVELQQSLVQREVDNGANGLLVAAEDPALGTYLETLSIPVVAIETGAGEGLPHIAADDVAMGTALAELYAAQGKTVAVLAENLHRQNISARYNAFLARANALGLTVTELENTRKSMPTDQFIRHSVRSNQPDVLVALDDDTLQTAARALVGGPQIALCGIGSSDAVVHALDQGMIDNVCFSNEYALGYIGTMTLAAEMGLAPPPQSTAIQYGIARKESLYLPENERVLFPITQ